MSAAAAPTFSVILTASGCAAADYATVTSILAQEEHDLELLIRTAPPDCDDPRMRVLGSDGDRAAQRDAALGAARGHWVAYAEDGDRWSPGHLTALRALLGDGARLAATAAMRVMAGGAVSARTSTLETVWHPELQVAGRLFEPGRVAHERDVVAAGGWQGAADGPDGWAMWLALADRGERFATTMRATATVCGDDAEPAGAAIPLSVVPDLAHATAALEFLRLPAVQARLRALHEAETTAWLQALHAAGELVLPTALDASELAALVARDTPHDTLPPLALRSHPEGVEIVRPLQCVSPAHGVRIETLTRARFPRKLAWLRRALSTARPLAYA